MARVRVDREIARPLAEVWAVLRAVDAVWRWSPAVRHSYAVGGGPMRVGLVRRCVFDEFGEQYVEERVSAFADERHRYVLEYVAGSHRAVDDRVTVAVRAEAAGVGATLVTIATEYRAIGGRAILAGFAARRLNRAHARDLAGLELHLLTGRPVTSVEQIRAAGIRVWPDPMAASDTKGDRT